MEPLLEGVDLTKIEVPQAFLPSTATRDDIWAVEPLTGRLAPIIRTGPADWALDGGGQTWNKLNWIIIGGESGRKARPTHVEWVRPIIRACQAAGVPVLFKQWGEWVPEGQAEGATFATPGLAVERWPDQSWSIRLGKKESGRALDGLTFTEFPVARAA
jgi:protein gp37